MTGLPLHQTSLSLSLLTRSFSRWRLQRVRGERIPESLWQSAVDLARERGVSPIASALKLDYYALKKRLDSAAATTVAPRPSRSRVPRFVELPRTDLNSISKKASITCALVLESEASAPLRLRLEIEGASPEDLGRLVRSVWAAQP